MADNPSFAADDVGGILYPRAKMVHGADGAATDASFNSPMPTSPQNEISLVRVAGVTAAPKFALISASSSATSTIVAAVTSAKLRVLQYTIVTNATCTVKFNSSVTPLTGGMVFDKGAQAAFEYGLFETAVGQPLTITAGDNAAGGSLVYVEVSA
jgi:hypothetical protein